MDSLLVTGNQQSSVALSGSPLGATSGTLLPTASGLGSNILFSQRIVPTKHNPKSDGGRQTGGVGVNLQEKQGETTTLAMSFTVDCRLLRKRAVFNSVLPVASPYTHTHTHAKSASRFLVSDLAPHEVKWLVGSWFGWMFDCLLE